MAWSHEPASRRIGAIYVLSWDVFLERLQGGAIL